MNDALGYYKILQVDAKSSAEDIKQSYHNLAKKWHPDYNKDEQSTDVFQKISQAYEVLSNEQKRTIYDILSIVYTKENYPDVENMSFIGSGKNVASVKTSKVISWLSGYKTSTEFEILEYSEALKKHTLIAISNWLLGWWHPKGFVSNIKSIISNYKQPLSKSKTLQANIHNMISYYLLKNNVQAAKYGYAVCSELTGDDAILVKSFVQSLSAKVSPNPKWNLAKIRAVQLIVPVCAILFFLFSQGSSYLNISESELWALFSKDKEINYYQQVNFGNGGRSVDDVVVGKVVSIPLNKSDTSKLYHLKTDSKIMYGPSDDFDLIKILPTQTTIRITGYTPDNVWARVMIDNGEIGFVHMSNIVQGIGKEIPFGSAIID